MPKFKLNNLDTSIDSELVEMLSNTKALIEASSFEKLTLYFDHIEQGYDVEQIGRGLTWVIGSYNKMPVVIDIFWNKVDGKLLGFYECTSLLNHKDIIKEWIMKNIPSVVTVTNSMNDHTALKTIGANRTSLSACDDSIDRITKVFLSKVDYLGSIKGHEFAINKAILKKSTQMLVRLYGKFTKRVSPKNWRTTGTDLTDLKRISNNIDNFQEITIEDLKNDYVKQSLKEDDDWL